MGLYDKEKEDRTMIPKSEYRHLIKIEEQVEQLYRRRRQILVEAEEDRAKGYSFEPKISIAEIDMIFNFLTAEHNSCVDGKISEQLVFFGGKINFFACS